MTKPTFDNPTWKWIVGVLLMIAGGLASVTYASMDHRVTTVETDNKTLAVQQAETKATIVILNQEVERMREAEEDTAAQLHELLGTQPRKPLR